VLAVGLGSGAVACASVDARTLHYVDGQLVSSRPISPVGYEAYLQARLALESDPPRLDEAAASIDEALRLDPDEPHLWTTRAEIADRAGDRDAALAAVRRALELAPDHEPARRLLTRLGGHGVAQTGAARAGHN
jgi:tetratricopeptide (TPR) repeat protein